MLLTPPPGATVAVVSLDHTFYSDRLWETDLNNMGVPVFFDMDLRLRAGWRLQNAFGLTFGSTREFFRTVNSGMCVPFDGTFDGAGASGDQDNELANTQQTIEIPLNLIPGNLLVLKSDARSAAYISISIFGLPWDETIEASVMYWFRTTTDAIVNVTYQ